MAARTMRVRYAQWEYEVDWEALRFSSRTEGEEPRTWYPLTTRGIELLQQNGALSQEFLDWLPEQ